MVRRSEERYERPVCLAETGGIFCSSRMDLSETSSIGAPFAGARFRSLLKEYFWKP
jgi:hypothetical protein